MTVTLRHLWLILSLFVQVWHSHFTAVTAPVEKSASDLSHDSVQFSTAHLGKLSSLQACISTGNHTIT